MSDNLVIWNEKFAIGIPLIDSEHKTLISLCNNLYKLLNSETSTEVSDELRKEAMSDAFRQCAEYSQFHFKHEEELMSLCHFNEEKFAEHKASHKSFTKKIFDEIKDFKYENYHRSCKFVRYLYDWILTHIAYEDKLYVNDLKNFLLEHPEIRPTKHQEF